MAKEILFVDDETNILLGLKRMLHSLRKELSFHFAESGQEALEILAEKEISVIVSDMRMPGMDGATLLTKVQDLHPQVIRIMLTGHADDQSILKTIPVVHQFLAKPSDPNTLKEVLTRACALQELLANKQLQALVAGLGSLPSLPEVYTELQEKAQDPDCSLSEIAAIIEKDLAMSTKVLQLVNSAFYGFYKNVDSPKRAVALLGLDTVKALVLGIGIFSELVPNKGQGISIADLWQHSLTVASFAKTIAMAENAEKVLVEQAFVSGIVHDIGKLLLFFKLGEQYLSATSAAQNQAMPIFQAEKQLLEADHGDVGGYLIGLWGLPGPVVEAVTFHHKLENYPQAGFSPALAVHAADVAYYVLYPDLCVGKPPVINQPYLEKAGLGSRFDHWLELCRACRQEEEKDD